MKDKDKNKNHRANASQFFVAGELCRRKLVAVVTMGNCPNTDILCSNKEGTKFMHIQVKTFRPGDKTCSVGLKSMKNYGDNFFWVLGGIPQSANQELTEQYKNFKYFIISAKEMSKNVSESYKIWLKTPGRNGRIHKENKMITISLPPRKNINGWQLDNYLNRWDLIEKKLK